MSIGFERPFLAAAAFVIIPLIIIASRFFKNPFTVHVPLGAPGGLPFKPPVIFDGLIKALRFLEYCGIFLMFIGAAGPEISVKRTVWLNRGADILFVLDISPSMAALDMNGESRFSAARELIKDFASRRPSDNIGLVAAGSDASLLLPPANDRNALFSRLDLLRIGELGDGTALGEGLAIAAFHLDKSGSSGNNAAGSSVTASSLAPGSKIVGSSRSHRRAVILVTDGENNAGAVHPETAAALLKNLGISLWVVGIGSSGDVPIDYTDPNTGLRRTGLFDSRYNTESLRNLSLTGSGEFLSAPSAEALTDAFTYIDESELIVARAGLAASKKSYSMLFLLAALGLLAGVRFVRHFFLGALS